MNSNPRLASYPPAQVRPVPRPTHERERHPDHPAAGWLRSVVEG